MSTEIPILYNEIRKEFDTALKKAAEGEYVPKPKSLYRYSKLRTNAVTDLRNLSLSTKKDLELKSSNLVNDFGISKLEAMNLVLETQATENNLKEQGVFFGDEVFNFTIDRPVITKSEEQEIIKASNSTMAALKSLGKYDLKEKLKVGPLFPTESRFEDNGLEPNAARIDFILTDQGPKIIEVNSQWVDAINAAAGFAYVYGDMKTSKNLVETFTSSFPKNSDLAIINIQQTTGSREIGATKELDMLARKILKTNQIRRCEVLDPNKVRLSYLENFSSFYLNFDPRAIGYNEPDWMDMILKRVKANPKAMFPSWRPLLDKKTALTNVGTAKKYLAPTVSLNDYKADGSPVILKGDGFSLNSVFSSYDSGFEEYLKIARTEPDSFVVQPFLNSKRFSCWAYDSGSKKIKYIKDGFTKLNIWWINGKVSAMLFTISESPLISDKGYNTYPLIKN